MTAIAGCGGDDADGIPPETIRAAERAAVSIASPRVERTKDRYLAGPRKVRANCRADGGERIICTATGYVRPQHVRNDPGAPFNVVIADEEWIVSVRENGKLGGARIGAAGYAISDYLKADHAQGCSIGRSLDC